MHAKSLPAAQWTALVTDLILLHTHAPEIIFERSKKNETNATHAIGREAAVQVIQFESRWGSGRARSTWVAQKRSYNIIELEQRGFGTVWCLDAESMPLRSFRLSEIARNTQNMLLVGQGGVKWRYPAIVHGLLQLNGTIAKEMDRISVRQHDFWLFPTEEFCQCVAHVNQLRKQPLSRWMPGSEQRC